MKDGEQRSLWELLKYETWILLKLAGPCIAGQGAFFLMNITDSIFIGRIGENELAGSALGTAYTNCIMYLALGLTMGLDTLASQAFGAGNYPLIGIYFQTCIIICTIACIPVLLLMWFVGDILLAIGQDPVVTSMAEDYVHWLMPGVWPFVMFHSILHWLQNQQILSPSIVVAILAIILNIPFNFLLIWGVGEWKGWGLSGAGLATSIVRIIMPICLWGYTIFKKYHLSSCSKLYKDAIIWKNIKTYSSYAFPAMLMVFFEVLGFEGSTILVGLLQSPVALSAHAIGFYVLMSSFILPFGFGIALNTHVGSLMGSGEADRGALVTFFGCGLIILLMFINSTIIWSARSAIAHIWAPSPEVHHLGEIILSITALVVIFDGYQFVTGCIVKSVGRQKTGSFIMFFGFYGIALPGGYVGCSILGYGVTAYWWSISLSLFIICLLFTIVIWRINWKEEVNLAAKRTQYDLLPSDEEEIVQFKPNV